jgi:hypothetical protein
LLVWPWKRFEKFWESFEKRRLIESVERRKDQMIAALWANSNYDDDRGTRQKALEEIEERYHEAVLALHGQGETEEQIDTSNPFFGQMRGVAKIEEPSNPNVTVSQVIDADIDQ